MGLKKYINNSKISNKLAALAACIILTFLIVASISMNVIIKNVLGDYINQEVKNSSDVLAQNIELMKKKSLTITEWFVSSPELLTAVKTGNRNAAVKFGQLSIKSIGFDFMVITDTEGKVFARTLIPGKYGDSIANQIGFKKAVKGESIVGTEEGSLIKFAVRAYAPIKDGNKIIGTISLGYILSTNDFPDEQKRLLGSDITVFLNDERIATSLIKDGKRLTGTKMEHKAILDAVLKQGKNYYGNATILGKLYHTAYLPLRDVNNNISGMLFLGKDAGVINNLIFKFFIYQNSILIVVGIFFMIVFYSSIKTILIKRLDLVTVRLKDIAEGEGDLTATLDEGYHDEIGQLSQNFNKFVKKIKIINLCQPMKI